MLRSGKADVHFTFDNSAFSWKLLKRLHTSRKQREKKQKDIKKSYEDSIKIKVEGILSH